jgi:hypothetical protein
MVAGYCWDWKSKTKPSVFDISIGQTYQKRWNLGSDGSLWIIAEESVSEVGCIHTCQGLELDYVGVIVGPDLIVREGKVLAVPERRSRQDQSLKGYKSFAQREPERAKREADRVIKNTYRTLMSRGMKGCYIYCTDEETAQHFRSTLMSA